MYKIILVVFLVTFGHLSLIYSGTIDPANKDSEYIEYGSKFIHTGKIHGTDQKDLKYLGSCIAISDKIVLTAAHILHDAKTSTVTFNGKDIKIKEWIIHKDFKHDKLGYNDIAICLLEESIGFDWYPKLYTNKDELNKICSLSGYGSTGTFSTGPNKIDDHKRAGSNIISSIEGGVLMCDPSTDSTKTRLEFFICPGDSGGCMMIDQQIAGIHSYTMKLIPSNKQYSCHTRISDHIEWINYSAKLLVNNEKNTK